MVLHRLPEQRQRADHVLLLPPDNHREVPQGLRDVHLHLRLLPPRQRRAGRLLGSEAVLG